MIDSLDLIDLLEGSVRLRRSGARDGEHRYYVEDGDTALGWVVRWGRGTWSAYLCRDLNDSTAATASQIAMPSVPVGYEFRTRAEAVREVIAVAVIRHLYRRDGAS